MSKNRLHGIIYLGDFMKKQKKKAIILAIVCIIVLVGAVIADRALDESNLIEIKYDDMMEKVNNKESFVVLFSQTTCSHCMDFKPKLNRVAKNYKVKIYYLETDLLDKETTAELKKQFSFNGTPTTIFVIDGEEKTAATRINGDVSEEKIISKLKSNGFISD